MAGEKISPAVLALQQAAKDLQGSDPSPFTPSAFKALTEIVDDFIADLAVGLVGTFLVAVHIAKD
jgi:hypothetical protein